MYGKLVNGELRGAPRPIRTENGDVFTNDPALLLQYGLQADNYGCLSVRRRVLHRVMDGDGIRDKANPDSR